MARPRKAPAGVETLVVERDRLIAEAGKLTEQAKGIDWAITALTGTNDADSFGPESTRGPGQVKILLLDLLEEVGATGLNATAVELAKNRGISLLRGTAASNLSRMKADDVVTHDGDRYRLPAYTRQPSLAAINGGKSS